jgi:hypothetical protein
MPEGLDLDNDDAMADRALRLLGHPGEVADVAVSLL